MVTWPWTPSTTVVAVKSGNGSWRLHLPTKQWQTPPEPFNTTASWCVEFHLHFLVLYFLKNRTNKKNQKSKKKKSKRTIVEAGEKQRLTWLLFSFPLDSPKATPLPLPPSLYLFVLFDWLHSGGREEKPSQLVISLPGLKQPTCCWVFELWIQYYLMSHMWKFIKLITRRFESKS